MSVASILPSTISESVAVWPRHDLQKVVVQKFLMNIQTLHVSLSMCIYIYTYIHTYMHLFIFILSKLICVYFSNSILPYLFVQDFLTPSVSRLQASEPSTAR